MPHLYNGSHILHMWIVCKLSMETIFLNMYANRSTIDEPNRWFDRGELSFSGLCQIACEIWTNFCFFYWFSSFVVALSFDLLCLSVVKSNWGSLIQLIFFYVFDCFYFDKQFRKHKLLNILFEMLFRFQIILTENKMPCEEEINR